MVHPGVGLQNAGGRSSWLTAWEAAERCVPLFPRIEQSEGFPRLTDQFESQSLPGFYLSGFVAAQHFGPYMGFLASCWCAARTAVDAIAAKGKLG